MNRDRGRCTADGQLAGTEARPSEERPEGLHILLIEDNLKTAESLALLLRHWGHVVRIAPDGPSAVEAAAVHLPDVALIDIALPGFDGYRVATWIGKQVGEKKPLLIAVTGLGRAADRQRSAEVGIDLHLVKPIDPERLKLLLRRFRSIIR